MIACNFGRPRRCAACGIVLLGALALACSRPASSSSAGSSSPAPAPSAASVEPLAPGAPAPDVTLAVHTGEQLSLSSLRGKPVVVYFYPKDDTPGCTVEAQEIRDLHADLQRTSAVVIGVSTDGRDSHQAFAEKYALPFLLASDEDGAIAKAFGVALKNGKATRVSFVIGPDGKIKRTFPKVTPRVTAASCWPPSRADGSLLIIHWIGIGQS
jgi:peroxiredoxin Q/BCP